MKLSTKVLEGRWDEEQGIWNLYVRPHETQNERS